MVEAEAVDTQNQAVLIMRMKKFFKHTALAPVLALMLKVAAEAAVVDQIHLLAKPMVILRMDEAQLVALAQVDKF
jgi:hypothetical protein